MKSESENRRGLFWSLAVFLTDHVFTGGPSVEKRRLQQELALLTGEGEKACRIYQIKKTQLLLAAGTGACLLFLLGVLFSSVHSEEILSGILQRPDYQEEDRLQQLEVYLEDGRSYDLELSIQSRKYTQEERDHFFDEAIEELTEMIPGENTSLEEIRTSLCLPETAAGGCVSVSWSFSPYGYIDSDGSIVGDVEEEGELVEIQMTLKCEEEERIHTLSAMLYPPILSQEEALLSEIREAASLADERDKYQETLTLPDQLGEWFLSWRIPGDSSYLLLLPLCSLALIGVSIGKDQEVHHKAAQRKEELLQEYPDFLWKLSMLIQAGLPIRAAFFRIMLQLKERPGRKKGYLCMEMERTWNEMKCGVPENKAYEQFGRRCQLTEYVRLGSYLSQNLKKGSGHLSEFLRKEAEASLEMRKNHAKELGEKAGTKVLFPMVLMLGVVMVILIVPAFLSFSE